MDKVLLFFAAIALFIALGLLFAPCFLSLLQMNQRAWQDYKAGVTIKMENY